MNKISKIFKMLIILTALFVISTPFVSAAVDFSALTDLINATMTIFTTFTDNSDALIGFFVLLGELTVVSAIIAFVVILFVKIGKRLDSKI